MGKLFDTCKAIRKENFDIVKKSMGKVSGGDGDGAFFFFDEPIEVEINHEEPFIHDMDEKETVFGVFFSDNRIVPADTIFVKRECGAVAKQMPHYSKDLHEKVQKVLLHLKEEGKLNGIRWNEEEGVTLCNAFRKAVLDASYLKKTSVWIERKEKYGQAIVLFRYKDLCETYGDDAEKVEKYCKTTFTTWGTDPMRAVSSFPYHSLDLYLPRLVRAGNRIVIVEEDETSSFTEETKKYDPAVYE